MTLIDNEQSAKNIQTLAAQQSIEEAYLDSLLGAASLTRGPAENTNTKPEQASPGIIQEPSQQPALESTSSKQNDKENALGIDEEVLQGTRPQLPFVCQLISIAGLKLALKLSNYTQVLSWPEEILPVSDGQKHLIGHMKSGACVFDIVDLTELIIGQAAAMSVENDIYPYSHVMLLQDGSTCIPCENILETVTVNPEKVCWRSSDSHRIWLAGTVKEDGFALLDTENIMQSLEINSSC